MDKNTGLVLEGGGMRGVFTSGVLDAFMKYNLYFPYVVGVSAGACNGMSYISRQPRRARISNIDYLSRYDYIGLRHLVSAREPSRHSDRPLSQSPCANQARFPESSRLSSRRSCFLDHLCCRP